MKYHIDTIPVWDAVKEDTECPFCLLQEKAEAKHLDYYLGDAIMQSHIRIRINDTGFCAFHYEKMLKSDRKLSLGLVCSTHSQKNHEKISHQLDSLIKNPQNIKKSKNLEKLIKELDDINNKCVICEDIDYDIMRYLHTYVYLFKKDPQFKQAMETSKGFCLKHFPALLKAAQSDLSGSSLSEFVSIASSIQAENLKRLEDEVKWFCDKFDYRNIDKPWGESKDALPRMVTKLGGRMQK